MNKFIATLFVLSSLTFLPELSEAQQIGPKVITKIAKEFGVAPDILSKFKDMALPDMRNGLGIAKQVATRGDMSMDEAASKVLGSNKSGKDWGGIASDFNVDPPNPAKAKSLKQN